MKLYKRSKQCSCCKKTKHQEELTELRKDLHKMSKFLHQKDEKKKEKEKK